MKKLSFCLLLLISLSLIPLFFFRAPYIETYDFNYVQDHFHHSQWEIPNSPWGIGDDGLYQYAGYQQAKGIDPYLINAEAPPIGKYLYGFSILIFNNPYFVILPAYFLTISLFFLLTSYFITQNRWRIFATLLFIFSPLFFSQLTSTTLDLFQICWLMLHVLCLFKLSLSKNLKETTLLTLLCGITLGLFIGTKFGLLGILVVVADTYLLFKSKRLWLIAPIVALGAVTYLTAYLSHFLHGGNILSWLRGQKWILNYWLHNQPKPSPFFIFVTLFSGFWTNLKFDPQWSIIWPTATFAFFSNCYSTFKEKTHNPHTVYITILLLGFLITFSINFFWVRYLIIALPFLIIFLTKLLSKKPVVFTFIISLLVAISTINYTFFSLNNIQEEIKYAWENGLYKDLYNYLPDNFREKYSRNEFNRFANLVDFQLGFPQKTVSFTDDGKVVVLYKTKLGNILNHQPVSYFKENGRWKMDWNWNLILSQFRLGDKIQIVDEFHPAGPIISPDGKTMSVWGELPLVSVIPEKIQDSEREKILKNLASATNGSKEKIRIVLYVKSQKDWTVPVGLLTGKPLLDSPAFKSEIRPARIYSFLPCQEKIGAMGIQNGGEIFLLHPDGTRIKLLSKFLGC